MAATSPEVAWSGPGHLEVPPRVGDHTGRRPSWPPGDIMPTIVPAVNGVRATEAPWFFGLASPSPGRGRTRPGESAGAYHVFKSGREPQPSGKRVDGLAVQQPSARRVGALLELEGDTHRLGLFHTGQHPNPGQRVASRQHRCFSPAAPGAAATQLAPFRRVERSAAGSSLRELMESFW